MTGKRSFFVLSAAVVLSLGAVPLYGYIGPGGLVSGFGALLALLLAVVVSLLGFVWYPLKRLVARLRPGRDAARSTPPGE